MITIHRLRQRPAVPDLSQNVNAVNLAPYPLPLDIGAQFAQVDVRKEDLCLLAARGADFDVHVYAAVAPFDGDADVLGILWLIVSYVNGLVGRRAYLPPLASSL
jgi:hypothetical protein